MGSIWEKTKGLFISPKKEKPRRRSYAGADIGRLFSDWVTSNQSADAELYGAINQLRSRFRDLERNNPYFERYLSELEANVIGEQGIRVTPRPINSKGQPDKRLAKRIAEDWAEFSAKGNFSACRRFSRVGWAKLMLRAAARDGDSLAEIVRGYSRNAQGIAVQGWEADYLNEDDNNASKNIRMGVRRDLWGGHVGYRISADAKNGDMWGLYNSRPSGDVREIPAENKREVVAGSTGLLVAVYKRFSQTRGVPWGSSVLTQLRQLGMYEEAALVSARIGAAKIGMLFDSTREPGDDDNAGNRTFSAEPGSITRFDASPDEMAFQSWDPSDPNGDYPSFRKGMLRGIAGGLKVSYNVLGSDLEGVSYSSIRQGTLSERELWKLCQTWWIETIEQPVYYAWLEWRILNGAYPSYSILDLPRISGVEMEGRRWDWVDPLKDVKAAQTAIEIGLSSRQRENRKRGQDDVKVIAEQAEDAETTEEFGVVLPGVATPEPPEDVEDDE